MNTQPQPLAPLYSVDDLAEHYRMSKDTLYDLLKSGEIVGFKLGKAWMVHVEDWNAYIDSLRANAARRSSDMRTPSISNGDVPH